LLKTIFLRLFASWLNSRKTGLRCQEEKEEKEKTEINAHIS
jgi:hypothetical protein